MLNYIFIGVSLLLVLIFIFSIAVIHLRSLRDDINLRWYNLLDKLQYRQDLVPNLVETVRQFLPEGKTDKHNDLIGETIAHRAHAAKNSKAGADKIIQEHDLSKHIEKLIDLEKQHDTIAKSTNFLELKSEFVEIRKEIEKLSRDYNDKVRHHNNVLKRKLNKFPAILLNYKRKQIFEFE